MIVLPVMARELRAAARHSFTYSLRALGVGALLLACLLFGLDRGFGPSLGGSLFASLHLTLFCSIWVLVPILTADCISRERREGTLGLLFLTRLRASDVVSAKSLAHGLRALTLGLAVLPVLTIPFLLGGVSWVQVLLSVGINLSAVCWALAAGLLASAWSKTWLRSLVGALILSFYFLLGQLALVNFVMFFSFGGPRQFNWASHLILFSDLMLQRQVQYIVPGSFRRLPAFTTGLPSSGAQVLWLITQTAAMSLLGLLLAVSIAGRRTRRVWQEQPPSRMQIWWQKRFCTPVLWVSFFRKWMLRKLERNPIGWLEQRTWTGRLVTWAWFAVIISLYSAVLTDRNFFRGYSDIQRLMAWLLAGSLAMSAAGSFRRERESGVLELLLVSPLGEGEIISGRLRGLWTQFFPAFGVLLGLWAYFAHLVPDQQQNDGAAIWFHSITFLTLPVIGLYFSLRCRNFLAAFLITIGVGLVIPVLFAALFRFLTWLYGDVSTFSSSSWHIGPSVQASVLQLVLAAACARALYKRLRGRAFPFNQESH